MHLCLVSDSGRASLNKRGLKLPAPHNISRGSRAFRVMASMQTRAELFFDRRDIQPDMVKALYAAKVLVGHVYPNGLPAGSVWFLTTAKT